MSKKPRTLYRAGSAAAYAALPRLLLAAGPVGREFATERTVTFLDTLRRLANLLIPLVIAFALLQFFWGMTKFIGNAADPDARKAGKRTMVVGILTLTFMSTVWWYVVALERQLGFEVEMSETSTTTATGSVPLGPEIQAR